MANGRYTDIHQVHTNMSTVMQQITLENKLANKLKKELEHEKVVLGERKAVSNICMGENPLHCILVPKLRSGP